MGGRRRRTFIRMELHRARAVVSWRDTTLFFALIHRSRSGRASYRFALASVKRFRGRYGVRIFLAFCYHRRTTRKMASRDFDRAIFADVLAWIVELHRGNLYNGPNNRQRIQYRHQNRIGMVAETPLAPSIWLSQRLGARIRRMMKSQFLPNKTFALGTLCASAATWLGLTLLVLMRLGIDALIPGITGNYGHFAKPWVDGIWMIFLIGSALALFFYSGVLCASFWRGAIRDNGQRQRWVIASALLLFAPLIPLGLWLPPSELGSGMNVAFLGYNFLTFCSCAPFMSGIHRGLRRQTLHRRRNFLGLRNE